MGVVGVALRGFGKALKAKKTKDLSKLDLSRKELKIITIKAKNVSKMTKDVEANPELFKAGTAFKKGHGKFGFNKPSGKK
jgi:hypothetical protein